VDPARRFVPAAIASVHVVPTDEVHAVMDSPTARVTQVPRSKPARLAFFPTRRSASRTSAAQMPHIITVFVRFHSVPSMSSVISMRS
jgi:hypothetical protein